MQSERQFRREAMQNKTQVFSQYPPIGGWNTRDDPANMDPKDAPYLENWFPDTTSVRVRDGCRFYSSVSVTPWCETLIEYNSPETNAIIVGSGGQIAAFNDTHNHVLASNFAKSEWQGVNFNSQMVLVNGVDLPQNIRGSVASFICTPQNFSGIDDPTRFVDAHVFKSRVFYVPRDSADFYYTETDAIGGSLTRFPLSRVARQGGKLVTIKSWTVDGGDGPDDIAVFIMSTGEVIAYQGTDPGRSGQWGLIGRYQMPPVIGRRCVAQNAGKIYAVTESDLVILPDVFQELSPPPSKLTGAISDAWAKHSTKRGWQFTVFQSGGIALLNVPTGEHTSEQFVINLKTAAATKYTGWNTFCFGIWNNRLFFSPSGSRGLVASIPNPPGPDINILGNSFELLRANFEIGDNLPRDSWPPSWASENPKSHTGVSGQMFPITVRAQLAPTNLGQQQYKLVRDYRMRISNEGTVNISSGLAYDFSNKPEFYQQHDYQTLGTSWGSPWGSSWSEEDYSKDDWLGASGEGTNVQLRNECVVSSQNLRWHRTDYRFENGPQIN